MRFPGQRPVAPVRAGVAGLCLALGAASLSGCSPAPLTTLPEGVTVAIQQNRDDYGPRRLEIVVDNAGSSALTVTGAAFRSDAFTAPATWSRPATIDAGTATNLRVQLAAAECGGVAASGALPPSTVVLDFTLPDGTAGSATVTPDDPFDAIAAVTTQDCAADAVAGIVTITLAPRLRTERRDGALVALLDVSFAPTGRNGEVTVERVSDTILVRSAASDGWSIGKRFTTDSAPFTTTLDFIPNNCRLHTVAEDKRGTYFPVTVLTEAGEVTFPVAASTDLKKQVYAYIADYCGWD